VFGMSNGEKLVQDSPMLVTASRVGMTLQVRRASMVTLQHKLESRFIVKDEVETIRDLMDCDIDR
jgi:hypothetical protein